MNNVKNVGGRPRVADKFEGVAIKLPVQQVDFLLAVGRDGDGRSYGLRIVLDAYVCAIEGDLSAVALNDYERGSQTVIRIGVSLKDRYLQIGRDAADGMFNVGFRKIIKAAMDGRFGDFDEFVVDAGECDTHNS